MHPFIILLPALVSAVPQPSTRAADVGYKYCFPSNFNHTGVPDTVRFDQGQFDHFSSLVPVKVDNDGEIVVIGRPNITDIAHYNDTRVDAVGSVKVTTALNPRCLTCISACGILGVLGPEAIVPCSK